MQAMKMAPDPQLEQRVMALENIVEKLQQEVRELRCRKPGGREFSLTAFLSGRLFQKTENSTFIEMERRINEKLVLEVNTSMSVDNLYQRLERLAMDIIFDKYIKTASV
jgi:hypothetical protein